LPFLEVKVIKNLGIIQYLDIYIIRIFIYTALRYKL